MTPSTTSAGSWADLGGGLVSAAYAVHCFVGSFAPAVFALTGASFLEDERLERGLVAAAIVLGAAAMARGFLRHRRVVVLGMFGLASTLLAAGFVVEGQFESVYGAGLSVLGGLAMVGAHLHNARCCAGCSLAGH